ncbi:phage tail tape measure protein [Microbacterium sp.]|uniref:phage tail tape measure protein n=1 Tax=Actinomycetes TaxID=1760 RepID=UPI0037CAA7BC
MAERVVKVRLTAQVSDYKKAMQDAAKTTREMGTEAEKLAATREAFQQVGRASVAMGALLAAGVAVAVSKFADFDQAMSNVSAATHESTGNMGLLRDAALEAGARTVFSATEAAGAIEELAKAGVSTADILNGGLNAALDLAAAGELGVAEAAGIASTALKVFKLQGADMGHVADLLAAGAGKAMGGVQDLSQALAQGGQVAAATGLSIEETTAILAAFASQGLLGSDAGTSFKTMLQRLTPQSAAARAEMERLGVAAYDAQGNFVGMEKFAGNLQNALRDLTPQQRNAALSIMFGSDAVRAANVIYTEGAEGIREWTDAVNDTGYAADTARRRLDNLKGDIEALGGAMDTALIQTGSAANDTLRGLVQALTGLVDMYNDLPVPLQQLVLAAGGATAAVALTGGAALLAVPKFAQFKAAIAASRFSMGGFTLTAGAAALALGGLFAIVGSLAARHAEAEQSAHAYAGAIREGGDAAVKSARDLAIANLQAKESFLWFEGDSAYDAARKLGISIDLVTDAALGNADAMAKVNEQLRAGGFGSDQYKARLDELGLSTADYEMATRLLIEAIFGENAAQDRARELIEQTTEAQDTNAASTANAATQYLNAAGEVNNLESQLRTLIDTVNKANDTGQDAVTSNLAYKDALAEVKTAIKENKAAWGDSTQAGRDNQKMLVDQARKAQEAAEAQFNLDGNTDGYRKTLEKSREALIKNAEAFGASTEEAEAFADQIFRIPTETEWKLIADTQTAARKLDTFVRTYNGKVITMTLSTNQVMVNGRVYGGLRDGSFAGNLFEGDRKVEQFASGGIRPGIYAGVQGGIFAEKEKGVDWEAFISSRASDRDRNVGIWMETGRRLGALTAGSSGPNVTVNQDIHPAPGMSEAQVGRVSGEQIAFILGGQ